MLMIEDLDCTEINAMDITHELAEAAALFLSRYWGERGTTKQVEKLMAMNTYPTTVRMAAERGFLFKGYL